MAENLIIEPDDVYEPPLLAEVGGFAERTQGVGSEAPEGAGAFWF
ncbi:lasso RiPP family leader peptide-containing protein [Streptomyces sp. NPDC057654]